MFHCRTLALTPYLLEYFKKKNVLFFTRPNVKIVELTVWDTFWVPDPLAVIPTKQVVASTSGEDEAFLATVQDNGARHKLRSVEIYQHHVVKRWEKGGAC